MFNSHRESGRRNKNCRVSQETSYFGRHKISYSQWLAAASGAWGLEEGCPWAKSARMATRFARSSSFVSKPTTIAQMQLQRLFHRRAKGLIAHNTASLVLFSFFFLQFIGVLRYNSKDRSLSDHTGLPQCWWKDALRGMQDPVWEDPRDKLHAQPQGAPGVAQGPEPRFLPVMVEDDFAPQVGVI